MSARAASVKSASSGGGSCSRYGRHRLVSRTSNVDESLFGKPAYLKQMTGNRSWGGAADVKMDSFKEQRKEADKSDVIQVITKDLIRNIKVPIKRDPSGQSLVLDHQEFSRIKLNSKVLSPKEKVELQKTQKREANERMEASNARKNEMQRLEDERRRKEKPSDLEEEAKQKGSELLSKAGLMLAEQDDEIKKLNESVLNAKCHAIRDLQLREKGELQEAMEDEQHRLDLMMEVERTRALRENEQKEVERQIQRLKGAKQIQVQIEEREQQRQLDLERKDQETQAMRDYLQRLQQEDLDTLIKKKQTQNQLMEEVAKCNQEMQRQKMLVKEREKQEDLKMMDYLKEKAKREEELQKELEAQKAEKELEIARLRAQQERAKDKQAERDALKAKRRQEEFEREWRRKQKEEAEKKQATNLMLKKARQEQVHHKEHFLAVQAMRDRAEFDRVLKEQMEDMELDRQKQEELGRRRHTHAVEVRKQVKMKEEEKIAQKKAFFEEGTKLEQEARERKRRLDEIKQKKLAELRAIGIPEKYCAEVSRKITAPPASFTMS